MVCAYLLSRVAAQSMMNIIGDKISSIAEHACLLRVLAAMQHSFTARERRTQIAICISFIDP